MARPENAGSRLLWERVHIKCPEAVRALEEAAEMVRQAPGSGSSRVLNWVGGGKVGAGKGRSWVWV